jgi:hypothetical protein
VRRGEPEPLVAISVEIAVLIAPFQRAIISTVLRRDEATHSVSVSYCHTQAPFVLDMKMIRQGKICESSFSRKSDAVKIP